MMTDYEKLVDALDSVTWYNGLAEIVLQWKDDDYFEHDDYALHMKMETYMSYDIEDRAQLQVIWMLCVCMFGNYGTSPRWGWVEVKNKKAFHKFIDNITTVYREDYPNP